MMTGNGDGSISKIRYPRIDARAVRRNVKLTDRIRRMLHDACPRCPKQLASSIAIDLADICAIGEKHRKHVKELLSLSLPKGNDRLGTILARIEVNLLFENDYHLRSLKKVLPRLWKKLEARGTKAKSRTR
jgi:hypothetical protein